MVQVKSNEAKTPMKIDRVLKKLFIISNIYELKQFGLELCSKEKQAKEMSGVISVAIIMAFIMIFSLYILLTACSALWPDSVCMLLLAIFSIYPVYRQLTLINFTKAYTTNGKIKESNVSTRFAKLKNQITGNSINSFDEKRLPHLLKKFKRNIILSYIIIFIFVVGNPALMFMFIAIGRTENIRVLFFYARLFSPVLLITILLFFHALEGVKLLALMVSCPTNPNPNSDN